ncbi:hypothetical protein LCGC14_0761680 [marine sediment metagenome]|uniref:Uncharacterized protein n=1 Tax=marine sediment metagenome TaxID=412755 RepID=A0A0F9Q4Y8_9ZZZZ|nr:hypothetical protein [bacterium]
MLTQNNPNPNPIPSHVPVKKLDWSKFKIVRYRVDGNFTLQYFAPYTYINIYSSPTLDDLVDDGKLYGYDIDLTQIKITDHAKKD